jgi:hypothetical protein
MLENVSVREASRASIEVRMPTKAAIPMAIIPAVRDVLNLFPPTEFKAILKFWTQPKTGRLSVLGPKRTVFLKEMDCNIDPGRLCLYF